VRRSLLLTLGLLVFFTVVVVLLYAGVWRTLRYERTIRTADAARALVLQLQLDLETGLRGYTSTGKAVFLQPYVQATRRFGTAFSILQTTTRTFAQPAIDRQVSSELALHRQWVNQVGHTLILHPRGRRAGWLQLHGKFITDQFRKRDSILQHQLLKLGQNADDDLTRTLAFLIAAGILVEAAILAFGLSSARAEEAAQRQRELYENEKRIADALQRGFSQPSLPMLPQLGLHGSYLPAEQQASVGGDWYDAFVVRKGALFFSIGDVTGHGIDAAVTMSRVRQSLIVGAMRESDPAAILHWTNETLFLQADRIVTAICGFVDLQTLEVRYAAAGHPPPVLAVPGEPARFLRYGGLPLGVDQHSQFATFTEVARSGALLVLYTDGLIEYKRNLDAAEAQLLAIAEEIVQSKTVQDPTTFIRERFFTAAIPADDVAVLTLRFAEGVADHPPETLLNALQLVGGKVS